MVSTEFTHAPCRHKHGPYSPLTSERAYERSHTGAGATDERRPWVRMPFSAARRALTRRREREEPPV